MSKAFRIALVAALLLGALAIGVPVAQAQEFANYTSGVQVANLEGTTANVTLVAYDANGPTGTPMSDDIPANGSVTFFPISGVASGFSGSIVVSSDKNVAAISNILGNGGAAGASYVGRSAGATTVLLPLLNKDNNGFTTWFSVQNAGQADANVTVSYSDGQPADTFTLKPGAARVIYQKNKSHAKVFAGTITSSQPVVAAVIQESNRIMFAYTGFSETPNTNPVFPLINANNSGYVTGLQIQNGGGTATNVTVSYTPTPGNGTACTETQTINPGASNTFALAAFANGANSTCAAGARFVGSATVTTNSANMPLVAIGNQLGASNGGAYSAFEAAAATNSVVMPLIMDRNSGYNTGFNVQNVGGPASQVTCVFSGAAGAGKNVVETLAPNAALNHLQFNHLGDKYVGSATCTAAEATTKLVAVVNELGTTPGTDQFLVYEGVNK